MKQRIGIAMALLGEPALLIRDEPINGLDTDGMRIMRAFWDFSPTPTKRIKPAQNGIL